jgi:Coenzyme PQQ synthesis protein D (PqqD)
VNAWYRRAEKVDWVVAGDEAVLFDSESGALFELDRWATSIWVALDGRQSLDEVTETIAASVDAPLASVRADVVTFCSTLSDQELIVPAVSTIEDGPSA